MNKLDKIENILDNEHVFLTGGGGVGKSHLTLELIEHYKKKNKQVITLGSTGISAINIFGQTIHSFFCFGICKNITELVQNDKYNKQRIKELNKMLFNADLIVIDEISMVSAALMDMIKYRLDNASFSGSILFVGDFFQLPPVNKMDKMSLFDNEVYAFESSTWKKYNPIIIELTSSKRTQDMEFFSILKQIRYGNISNEILKFLDDLRKNVEVYKKSPTILFGKNFEADLTNKRKLNEINGEIVSLMAKEVVHDKNLNTNKLQNWQKTLTINMDLQLKTNAQVIFCTNKWGKYYNGEQGVVREINDKFLLIEKENSLIKVEPHEFTLYESVINGSEITNKSVASVFQFPVRLSYAITIHKSQGMSIENLVCNIQNIFEAGQFYVAISRAKSSKGLCLEYLGGDFYNHIRKSILVDDKVKDFYLNCKVVNLDNEV